MKHGMSYTKFYYVWGSMLQRCQNENNARYKDYGGRGITVCDRWHKFENFRDDMLKSYEEHSNIYGEEKTTIDRIDVDGNYEPSNCRWTTQTEQVRNQRRRS